MSRNFMLGFDSIDAAFKLCEEHVCKVNGWETPGDKEHGKGWAAVRKEWEGVMHKLIMQNIPIINIVHEKVEEQVINRTKVNRIVMNLPKRAKEIIADRSDFIMYYGFNEKDEPILFCKPSTEHEIGRRGSKILDMSPIKPSYEALNERIESETGMTIQELGPMFTIIGRPKIGKTTLLSEFPEMILFDFENGAKFLKKKFKACHLCTTWSDFKTALNSTMKEK